MNSSLSRLNTSHSERTSDDHSMAKDQLSVASTATAEPVATTLTPEEAFANAMQFITSLKESGQNAKTPLLDTIRGQNAAQSPHRLPGSGTIPIRAVESPRRKEPTMNIQQLEAESGRIIAQSASFRESLNKQTFSKTPSNIPRFDSKASAVSAAVQQLPGWSLPDLSDPLLTEALVEALCVKDSSGAWVPDEAVIKNCRTRTSEAINEVVAVHFNEITRVEETARNEIIFDEDMSFGKILSLEMREKAVSWSASVRNELNRRKPSTAQATPIDPNDLSQWLVSKGMSPVEANFFVNTSLPTSSTPVHIPLSATVDVPVPSQPATVNRVPVPAEVLFGENPLQSPIRSGSVSQLEQPPSASGWNRVEEVVDGMTLVHWVRS
eukprot:TRINITY_DN2561_c2_g4_i1.p1 TRINITY_DN2561_c2_g4~~TRINITY_DN2561_c2_g4_i1.p1  ORF type:complete len:381 (+),score=71.89 TRINITY_DN2561_c2_g4_i1:65-1207(+)